ERLPELSLIQNIPGVFVESIDAKLQTVSYLLCHARIEVMGPLRFYRRVERNGGFVGCAGKLRDRTLVDIFQGRWGKIARVTAPERVLIVQLVAHVDLEAVGVDLAVHARGDSVEEEIADFIGAKEDAAITSEH